MGSVSHHVAFLGIVAAAIVVTTANAREFQSSDVLPADAPTVEATKHMGELLRERTGGRLGIKFGHSDKDSENFTVGQVRTGLLDMARVNLAVFNSMQPETIVPSLPYLFRSAEHMRRVLDGPIGDRILAAMEPAGFVGLCFYDLGARSFYSTKGPIRNVGDFKGLSVRVQPSDIWAEMIRTLGAKPIAIPFDQVAAALKAGVIDASENNWPTYVATGHHRVAKYYSLTEHSMMPGVLVFSRKVWTELSPADQRSVRASARDSVAFMRGKLDAYEVSARLTAENSGSQVIDDVDHKSFADALRPLYSKLLPNPRLQEIIREVQAGVGVAKVP
jgi:tripartite ATP-independent transporter DctP family solute receptor